MFKVQRYSDTILTEARIRQLADYKVNLSKATRQLFDDLLLKEVGDMVVFGPVAVVSPKGRMTVATRVLRLV